MPISPAFTAQQSPSNPNTVVLVDDSTGSDVAISSRRVYIQNSSGDYLVPTGTTTSYVVWPYADDSISLDILDEDTAVSIKLDWLNSGGTILYTLTQQFCLDMYSKLFFYQLVQMQGVTPSIPQDTNYFSNMALFWATVEGAENAIVLAQDLAASQNCLNRCTYMIQQQSNYF
jgi:hypothetical protein